MISDILSDAVDEIRRYLREIPSAYVHDEAEILVLLAAMDVMRRRLDLRSALIASSSGEHGDDPATKAEILVLLAAMDAMRLRLDLPPPDDLAGRER